MVHRGITRQALASAVVLLGLVRAGSLRLRKDRVGSHYDLSPRGDFAIFRETVCDASFGRPEHVVLVVGFRLKVLRSYRLGHWLFQRCCILTTPFWAGFPGFHVKLWMVDPKTKNYLGIYDWVGDIEAHNYVSTLVRVLRPLSVRDTVWYELLPANFEEYLAAHKQ